jgi:hypothetical protein
MRNRRPKSALNSRTRPLSEHRENGAAPLGLERIFTAGELDVDDLAEAIRLLLESDIAPATRVASFPDADLLSSSPRGTHVMEGSQPA